MSAPMNPKRLIVIVGGLLFAGFFAATYISFYDTAVRLENTTRAQFQENQNVYDAYWKTISELTRVPAKYKDDFKDLVVGNTSARYGADGSKAQVQFLREHAINLDPGMYTKVMTVIESGREKFASNQKRLLDKQRAYRDHLMTFSGKVWAGMTGHPKPVIGEHAPSRDLDGDGKLTVLDYSIVTSTRTRKAFAEGIDDEPIPMFGDDKK